MFCCCCSPKDDINSINAIIYEPEQQEKNINNEEITKMNVKDSFITQDGNSDKETRKNLPKDYLPSNPTSITSSWNLENPAHFEINIQFRHQTKKIKVKKKYKLIKIANKFIESESKSENISFDKVQFSYHGKILNLGKTLEELGISQDDTLELI